MADVAVDRQTLLEATASSEGQVWADWWRDELERQGRRYVGGWPGTLSEARGRIVRRIVADLGPGFRLTPAELYLATRCLYLTAKRSWDAGSDPDLDSTIEPEPAK